MHLLLEKLACHIDTIVCLLDKRNEIFPVLINGFGLTFTWTGYMLGSTREKQKNDALFSILFWSYEFYSQDPFSIPLSIT